MCTSESDHHVVVKWDVSTYSNKSDDCYILLSNVFACLHLNFVVMNTILAYEAISLIG